ncbi:MAG: hypothetical protein ACK4XJ_10105 [Fimbriimonadaceae bacterium]
MTTVACLAAALFVSQPTVIKLPGSFEAPEDAQARSISVLRARGNELFIGNGDWNKNRGPVWLWRYRVGEQPEKVILLSDEAIDVIRVIDGRLYIPGVDSMESHEFGSLYVELASGWAKYRTVPRGLHVFDVAAFSGELFVGTGSDIGGGLFASKDDGKTWRQILDDPESFRICALGVLGDKLLAFPSNGKSSLWVYERDKLVRLNLDLFPGISFPEPQVGTDGSVFWRQNVHRLEAFQGKLLYTVSPGYNSRRRGEAVDRPLFLLSDLDQSGILRVPFFTDMTIADIKARSDRLYVLAVEEAEKSFVAKVYETTDLNHWQLVLQHSCSAFPNALEIMPNQFVIGLANPSAGESNTSSGDILIFQRLPTPAPYFLRKTR